MIELKDCRLFVNLLDKKDPKFWTITEKLNYCILGEYPLSQLVCEFYKVPQDEKVDYLRVLSSLCAVYSNTIYGEKLEIIKSKYMKGELNTLKKDNDGRSF